MMLRRQTDLRVSLPGIRALSEDEGRVGVGRESPNKGQ